MSAFNNLIIGTTKPGAAKVQAGSRGSVYRGASRNGTFWQVQLMEAKVKYYSSRFDNDLEAATFYDHLSICLKGRKAKTNFTYSVEEVRAILSTFWSELAPRCLFWHFSY